MSTEAFITSVLVYIVMLNVNYHVMPYSKLPLKINTGIYMLKTCTFVNTADLSHFLSLFIKINTMI